MNLYQTRAILRDFFVGRNLLSTGTKERQRELGPTAIGGGCLGDGLALRLGCGCSETGGGCHCKCPTCISGVLHFFLEDSEQAAKRSSAG